jgi:hypothetical protein
MVSLVFPNLKENMSKCRNEITAANFHIRPHTNDLKTFKSALKTLSSSFRVYFSGTKTQSPEENDYITTRVFDFGKCSLLFFHNVG